MMKMAHSVEDFYDKIKVMHDKSVELHRERYRVQGWYDKQVCQYMVDDIKALARDIEHGLIDLNIDFGKKT